MFTPSPDDFDRVIGEVAIVGQNMHALHHGLSNQHAVKRVSMMEREFGHLFAVRHFDGKPDDQVPLHFLLDGLYPCLLQLQLAETDFDGDFPQARCTQVDLVLSVQKGFPGSFAQTTVASQQPEERMGIDQNFHSM